MKKIVLFFMFFSFVFGSGELLLDSANAYKSVIRVNKIQSSLYMEKANAVMIFPKFIKAGFLFGGAGGNGVLMIKNGDTFTPKFVKMGGVSLGLQIGYDDSFVVIYVMKKDFVSDLLASKSGKFAIDADASVSFMDKGANAQKIGNLSLNNDFYIFSDNSGLFAGAKFGGSGISLQKDFKFDINSYGFKELVKALNGTK